MSEAKDFILQTQAHEMINVEARPPSVRYACVCGGWQMGAVAYRPEHYAEIERIAKEDFAKHVAFPVTFPGLREFDPEVAARIYKEREGNLKQREHYKKLGIPEAQEPKDFIMQQPLYYVARVIVKHEWQDAFGIVTYADRFGGFGNGAEQRMILKDAFTAKEKALEKYGNFIEDIEIFPAQEQSQMFWQGRKWPQDFSESQLVEALEEPKDFIMGQNMPWVIRMRYKWQAQSIPWQYWCYAGFKYVTYLPDTELVPYPDKAMAEQSLKTRHFGDDQIVEIVPWSTLFGEDRLEVKEGVDPKDFIMQQKPRYVLKGVYREGVTVIYVRNNFYGLNSVDWTTSLWEAQRFGAKDAQGLLKDLKQRKESGHFESIKEFSLVLLQEESIQESKKETLIGSVVAVWKNKVALVKGKKHWTLPAGRTKDSESVFHAAARECQEESGLKIKAADLIFVGLIKRSKHKSDSIFAHRLEKEQTLVAGSDAKEAMWFSLDKLPKLAFGHGVAIKKAMRVLKMKPEERGQLVAFEGVDGSGKSTQVELTVDWLKEQGYPVVQTKWNSSPLVSPAIKQGKKEKQLSPMLYHLLHSADLLHRYEQIVVPALARNFVVVCDRYWPTGIVRDRLRGVKDKSVYAKLRKPDVLFYCAVQPEEAVKRLVKAGRLSWYGIGMDLNYADDEQDNALEYTKRMKSLYARSLPSRHVPLDCGRKVSNIFKDIQRRVTRVLDRHYFHGQNVHERAEALVANLLEAGEDPRQFMDKVNQSTIAALGSKLESLGFERVQPDDLWDEVLMDGPVEAAWRMKYVHDDAHTGAYRFLIGGSEAAACDSYSGLFMDAGVFAKGFADDVFSKMLERIRRQKLRTNEAQDPKDYILGGKNNWELRLRDEAEAEKTMDQDALTWPLKPGESIVDFYCNGEHVGYQHLDASSLAPADQRLLDYWKRQIETLDSWDQFHAYEYPNHGIWEWLMKHQLHLDRPATAMADEVYAEGPERLKRLGWMGEAMDPKDFIMGQRPVIFNIVGTHREPPHNQLYLQWNGLFGSAGPAVWRGGAEQADRWVALSQGSHEALYRDIHMVPEVKQPVAEAEAKNFIMKAKQPKFRIRAASMNPGRIGQPIWLAYFGQSLRWTWRREEGAVYSAKLADARLKDLRERIPWMQPMLEIVDESVTENEDPKGFINANAPDTFRLAGTDDEGVKRWLVSLTTQNDAWSSYVHQSSLFTWEEAQAQLEDLKKCQWIRDIHIEPVAGQSAKEGYWRWQGQ